MMSGKVFEGQEKEKAITPIHQSYFHGEDWYTCPVCGRNFEFWTAHFNEKRCPQCGQKFNFR